MKLDKIDYKMLNALSKNGRISISELAEKIGLSPTPCRLRFEKLRKEGYILGFHAQLNADLLDKNHIAFVEVKLEKTDQKTLDAFNRAVQEIPEIEQAHMIAGSFDYLLKLRTKTIEEFRQVLGEVISTLPAVQSTSTNVSMQAVKENAGWGSA